MIPLIVKRHLPHPGRILSWECKLGCLNLFARDLDEAMQAYLKFFAHFDHLGFYCDLDGDESDWYKQAEGGDAVGAYWLVTCRSDSGCEYEEIETMFVETPCT